MNTPSLPIHALDMFLNIIYASAEGVMYCLSNIKKGIIYIYIYIYIWELEI